MKIVSKIILISLLIVGTHWLGSCIKLEDYPVVPAINFQDFKLIPFSTLDTVTGQYPDSAGLLTFSYSDGDGDIGIDTLKYGHTQDYNCFVKFLFIKNSQLIEPSPEDSTFEFVYKIGDLTPAGRNKNIQGQISIALQLYLAWIRIKSDTIAFKIHIQDRALHNSNEITTPLFIVKRTSHK